MKWKTAVVSEQHLQKMDDDYVVFNVNSGSTHLLGFVAGQILLQLESASMDKDSLTLKLAAQWEQTMQPDFVQGVESVLTDLQSLDLIQCA